MLFLLLNCDDSKKESSDNPNTKKGITVNKTDDVKRNRLLSKKPVNTVKKKPDSSDNESDKVKKVNITWDKDWKFFNIWYSNNPLKFREALKKINELISKYREPAQRKKLNEFDFFLIGVFLTPSP